ncbi:hypothetical protein EDC04DRAFT_1172414 [Pisolithus marmoratus]|nr:hypothetical protein EDC04DRAFT_1172414 [Pisolithus marmoratus]
MYMVCPLSRAGFACVANVEFCFQRKRYPSPVPQQTAPYFPHAVLAYLCWLGGCRCLRLRDIVCCLVWISWLAITVPLNFSDYLSCTGGYDAVALVVLIFLASLLSTGCSGCSECYSWVAIRYGPNFKLMGRAQLVPSQTTMQSNSSSLRAKRQRTLSRFRPYQSGRHELLSPPHLTRSKVMT